MGRKQAALVRSVEQAIQPVMEGFDELQEGAVVAVEPNIELMPLWMMKEGEREDGVAEASDTIVTADGTRVRQLWRVTASRDYELPGPFDQDVYVAVCKLVDRRGGMPSDGKVRFSLYELIKVMKLPKKGDNNRKIRESLLRMAHTTIHCENAFYRGDTGSYETETFHPWRVHLSRNVRQGRGSEHHTLKFDEVLARSYQANHLKGLDADFYFSLSSPIARRMYRLIDAARGDSLGWSVDLERLRQLAVLSSSYKYPSRIKQALAPAHRELVRKGFLKEAAERDGRPAGMRYRVAARFDRSRMAVEVVGMPPPSLQAVALKELKARGVWSNVASNLLNRFGAEKCLHAVEALGVREGVEHPGPYLKKMIEEAEPTELAALAETAREALTNNGAANREGVTSGRDGDKTKLPLSVVPRQQRPEEAGASNDTTRSGGRRKSALLPQPQPGAVKLWGSVLEDLAVAVDSPGLRAWFDGTVPVAIDDETLTLSVPNPLAEEYIASRFKEGIERLLKERLSDRARLRLEVSSPTFDG